MQKTLSLLAAASAAVFLTIPATRAAPAARIGLDDSVERAHSVRICDDDGDCWWSNRHHGRYDWDENHRWRRGWRDRDEDYDGRGDFRRGWDRDEDHGRFERHGYRGDRDDWGRSGEHEHHAHDIDRDRDRDDRTLREETPRDRTKERGGVRTPGAQATPESKKE